MTTNQKQKHKEKDVDLVGRMNALFWSARNREYEKKIKTVHVDLEDFYCLVRIAIQGVPEESGDIFHTSKGQNESYIHQNWPEWNEDDRIKYIERTEKFIKNLKEHKHSNKALQKAFDRGLEHLDKIYG